MLPQRQNRRVWETNYVIGVMKKGESLAHDAKSGIYCPKVYDGFLSVDGSKHGVKLSSRTLDKDEALIFFDRVTAGLRQTWETEATRLGVTKEQQRRAPVDAGRMTTGRWHRPSLSNASPDFLG